MQHDTFSRNARNQLRQVFKALRELTALPEAAPKQPIRVCPPEEQQGPVRQAVSSTGLATTWTQALGMPSRTLDHY